MKTTRRLFTGWGITWIALIAQAQGAAATEPSDSESLTVRAQPPYSVQVRLRDGSEFEATRARLWWLGRVEIERSDSLHEFPRGDVLEIRDGEGKNWTKDVIHGERIFQGDAVAPTRAGAYGNIHAFRRTYALTEAGVMFRLNEPYRGSETHGSTSRADRVRFLGDYGAMVNVNRSAAIGGTFFASAYGDGGSVGFRGRYRRWLSPLSSVDLSLGASFAGWSQFGEPQPFAPIAGITYSHRDQVLLKLQVDVTNFDIGERDVAVSGGISVGSKAGLLTSASAAIIGAIAGGIAAAMAWDPYSGAFQ